MKKQHIELQFSYCDTLLLKQALISIVQSQEKSNLFHKVKPKCWTLLKSNLFQSVVYAMTRGSRPASNCCPGNYVSQFYSDYWAHLYATFCLSVRLSVCPFRYKRRPTQLSTATLQQGALVLHQIAVDVLLIFSLFYNVFMQHLDGITVTSENIRRHVFPRLLG